jgi:hypothetical protein
MRTLQIGLIDNNQKSITNIMSGQLTIIPVGAGSPRYLRETRKPVNPPRPLIAVNRSDMI